jgi:hypothetical protein
MKELSHEARIAETEFLVPFISIDPLYASGYTIL